MKILIAFLLLAVPALPQDLASVGRNTSGDVTRASSECGGASCVWLVVPYDTSVATVQLSGTFEATVQFEGTTTGVVYSALTSLSGVTSATQAGSFSFNIYGMRAIRVRGSAYTSGTVHVDIGSSMATPEIWSDDGSTVTPPVGRNVAIGATVLSAATSEPACDSSKRGYIVRVQGGAGVADTYRQCIKGADDNYSWSAFGGGGVASFNGRTGAVSPAVGDYGEKIGWGFCATAACANTDVVANPYIATDTRTVGICYIASGTAPVGANLIVQVKKNGVNSFTVTQTATHTYDKMAAAGVALAEGDVLTAAITQVGSTTPGQNVTVICKVQ